MTPTIGITGTTKGIPTVCYTAWKQISYSAKFDTEQTVKEIRQNNAAQAAYCKETR